MRFFFTYTIYFFVWGICFQTQDLQADILDHNNQLTYDGYIMCTGAGIAIASCCYGLYQTFYVKEDLQKKYEELQEQQLEDQMNGIHYSRAQYEIFLDDIAKNLQHACYQEKFSYLLSCISSAIMLITSPHSQAPTLVDDTSVEKNKNQKITSGDKGRFTRSVYQAGQIVALFFKNKHLFADDVIFDISKNIIDSQLSTDQMTDQECKNLLIIVLSGMYARKISGLPARADVATDLTCARKISRDMVMRYGMSKRFPYGVDQGSATADSIEKAEQEILEKASEESEKLMTQYKSDLEKVAKMLMEKEGVTGSQLRSIFVED